MFNQTYAHLQGNVNVKRMYDLFDIYEQKIEMVLNRIADLDSTKSAKALVPYQEALKAAIEQVQQIRADKQKAEAELWQEFANPKDATLIDAKIVMVDLAKQDDRTQRLLDNQALRDHVAKYGTMLNGYDEVTEALNEAFEIKHGADLADILEADEATDNLLVTFESKLQKTFKQYGKYTYSEAVQIKEGIIE